jgi:glycosyltransferase involved in cell wall biosynthesis
MRVLLINTSERIGGAAIAASRLVEALKNNGVKAKLLVRDKQTKNISVVQLEHSWLNLWSFVWERVVIWMANRFRRNNLFAVDIANTGINITSLPEFEQADVIHLHWINQGMLSLKDIRKILRSGKPVVWTMHDMWPLTGICHHARECTKYQTGCNHCPLLYSGGGGKDLSYRIFNRKKNLYKDTPSKIKFVAVSQWQREQLEKSALLGKHTIDVIPNMLLLKSFGKLDRRTCRNDLNLPADKYIIAFGASRMDDPVKGFPFLIEAIRYLDTNHIIPVGKIHLVLFGKVKNETIFFTRIPTTYSWLGTINDTHLLSKLYSATDIYTMPSLYETFGQTLIEAMACGCVPVAFDNSGPAGIIDHLHNGYTARYKSAEDLANGIRWILSEADYALLSEQAIRKVAAHYSERIVAKKYIDLYNKVTGTHA